MHDQAKHLRELMRQTLRIDAAGDARPWLAAVVEARFGDGGSAVAANLAAELARLGQRVILAQTAPAPAGSITANASPGGDLADVIAGRRSLHEVLSRGPLGVQIAPAGPGLLCPSPADARRLAAEFERLGGYADFVILDCGAGAGEATCALASAADEVLVVTAPDDPAVMDSYAVLKGIAAQRASDGRSGPLAMRWIVMPADEDLAGDVHNRIVRTARRFLDPAFSSEAFALAGLEHHDHANSVAPLVVTSPRSAAARALERLAGVVVAAASERRGRRERRRLAAGA